MSIVSREAKPSVATCKNSSLFVQAPPPKQIFVTSDNLYTFTWLPPGSVWTCICKGHLWGYVCVSCKEFSVSMPWWSVTGARLWMGSATWRSRRNPGSSCLYFLDLPSQHLQLTLCSSFPYSSLVSYCPDLSPFFASASKFLIGGVCSARACLEQLAYLL